MCRHRFLLPDNTDTAAPFLAALAEYPRCTGQGATYLSPTFHHLPRACTHLVLSFLSSPLCFQPPDHSMPVLYFLVMWSLDSSTPKDLPVLGVFSCALEGHEMISAFHRTSLSCARPIPFRPVPSLFASPHSPIAALPRSPSHINSLQSFLETSCVIA
jgi:hypothetical protein